MPVREEGWSGCRLQSCRLWAGPWCDGFGLQGGLVAGCGGHLDLRAVILSEACVSAGASEGSPGGLLA